MLLDLLLLFSNHIVKSPKTIIILFKSLNSSLIFDWQTLFDTLQFFKQSFSI